MLAGEPRGELAFGEPDGAAVDLVSGQLTAFKPIETSRRADVQELGDVAGAEERLENASVRWR
jgi:hypothetical protein